MKYAVILSSIMALFITGCSTNDNGEGRNNIARNTSNVNERVDQGPRYLDVGNRDELYGGMRREDYRPEDVRHADDAANQVEELKEVKHAVVIMTDNNAYVGATLIKGTRLTKRLEEKIASAIRKENEMAEHVYTSTNPDFVDRMDGYVNDLKNDRPVRGLADEFGETVRDVYPGGPS
ncbi:YhcN/YlaJ family sporulation lipoprotein [Bacillus sp. V59.32b]|uniref:YhcN/YlaJ family sporulation lipoprotein n=1 Tax=Bacillus sp. V59.32b TaxID=1758642 RepID=UPI000E3D5F10|nr:YhcN/YlaJ family sporulation lipoprotein [Bacillus sp. V59.32b]RFU69827.1 YhcN/YlaJ family sporulation lipoprotein [Bacillus sp. V59.32b]